MANVDASRGSWGSKIGFIVAAAGSAIGLGNIWRFPYVTGENGGAIFVLIYIIFVILIGWPVMVSELAIGRHTIKNPVGAFKTLFPNSLWKMVGALGVVTGIGILSFYAVIAGYTVGYFIKTILGEFARIETANQAKEIFVAFTANPYISVGLLFLFILLTVLVVMGGVSAGIERWSKILMPILLLLLILLAAYSIALPKAKQGLIFYLKPDFSKFSLTTLARALGQALFSLSLGMGTMITYGSYISKKDNLVTSAGYVCFFDTLIAILAGLVVFPALFAMDLDPAGGPGLVFVVLPSIFAKMPGGMFFGAGIFLLLAVAALTSTISLLEVPVAYLVDEHRWPRKKAVLLTGTVTFLIGIPSALALGANKFLTAFIKENFGFLDFMNALFGNYSLSLGAFLIAVFAGYQWGTKAVAAEITQEGNIFFLRQLWIFSIRFICPIAIFIILAYIAGTGNYF
ncbi:MAG: sodium-dependent transporter [candidate division KSB1 bacterium]|nr:sodium-dependent transporter [candidate division KSB1 bacterium]MDZ7333991.1 sodium-dependent transporter [candidate division KSB1 bacterium]MDZ7357969.1 sodium-dependent transporter [candidate division KSB1 bacterium]MDZ7399976.1 sodium-dependent transporter [candidate division KSB1 bacterium]